MGEQGKWRGFPDRGYSSMKAICHQLVLLSFESNYERGLSAAGEKLHSGACKFSPAAESPRSQFDANDSIVEAGRRL